MADIRAGKLEDLMDEDAELIIVDLGFSSKKSTCVWDVNKEDPQTMSFANAVDKVAKICSGNAVNLILEAPLSCGFDDKGNPAVRRNIERRGSKTRGWHSNRGGAVTFIAACVFLRKLLEKLYCDNDKNLFKECDIRLFEGFVSFKNDDDNSHERDCKRMNETIEKIRKGRGCLVVPSVEFNDGSLVGKKYEGEIKSIFWILGMKEMEGDNFGGIPKVIVWKE